MDPCDSFFNFFRPSDLPSFQTDNADPDLLDEFRELLQADYEVGEFIKDHLVPFALDWFMGLADDSTWKDQQRAFQKDSEYRNDTDESDEDEGMSDLEYDVGVVSLRGDELPQAE